MVNTNGIQPDSPDIVSVEQDICRVKRNVNGTIIVVVRFLHTRLENTNDLETDPVNSDPLSHRGDARKQFVPGFGADHREMTVAEVIFVVDKASGVNVQRPDILQRRIKA